MIKIGKKLKQVREKKKISQDELAFSLGTSQKTISNWETDKGSPTLSQLAVLENVLETDVLSWFEEGGIVFKQKINHGDNAGVINKDSDKLIAQYEVRLAEKDKQIDEMRGMIKQLMEKK
ncbi:MAG: helix-turn-helix transcriptional regulator [Flavobacteriaceae bacterium]|jgi:transcriptional regulator with XRE-family HTH domain|nr:helix-turn-helix transcriptional regulator [Flavobacteriaceae bacterium]